MDFETILYEKRGHKAYLTLNRPEFLNAINLRMAEELAQAWHDVKQDDDVWVVVLTAAGERSFCAGVDVKEDTMARRSLAQGARHIDSPASTLTSKRNGVFKPVVCAVNGYCCAGGGMQFVLDSDVVICSDNATFFDPHVSIGRVSATEPNVLARRLPYHVVTRMAVMGNKERLDARRAYELGLVTQVVPLKVLHATADHLADQVLENGPLAVRWTIEGLFQGQYTPNLKDAQELAFARAQQATQTQDYSEGVRAFLEHRKPQWKAK